MKRNNKKGFTIVELVIVIAVIAILSAVLIPTFGTVINDANNVARDQEAKNLFTEYLIDHQGTAPNGTILIVDGTDKYYYTISGNQIDLDEEEVNPQTAPTDVFYCNNHADAAHGAEGHDEKCNTCGATIDCASCN